MFEDIVAWQKAREMTKEIYRISKNGPFFKDFGLRDQIRRASTSVMSNVAEGFERDGAGEFHEFLSIAKDSIGEVKSQLYVAIDQEYIDRKTFDRLLKHSDEVGKMIGGLMGYIRKTKAQGPKYKAVRLSNSKREARN
jgi:four helix bundle protein